MLKSKALDGLKVIDVSTMFAAGNSSSLLGDFGADVIKIEHPRGDPIRKLGWKKNGESLWWKLIGRNKKCITLNLSTPEGQKILKSLAKDADVLIENFRPGTLEKWNLGYEELKKINPGLIMLRITGFGQDGPYSDQPGFGTLAEALSGLVNLTGFPDETPVLPPVALADFVASIFGVYSVMVAIYHRTKTGEGQYIDLSLVETIFSILGPQASVYDQLGEIMTRTGNRSNFTAPRNLYKTKDEMWVALSASTPAIAQRVLRLVGGDELMNDERFVDNEKRMENREILDKIIAEWIGNRDQEEVLSKFKEYEGAIAPVYNISDIMKDPHFQYRNLVIDVQDKHFGKIKIQNVAPRLSKTPGSIAFTGPELGEHNHEIFVDKLSLSEDEIENLRSKGVI